LLGKQQESKSRTEKVIAQNSGDRWFGSEIHHDRWRRAGYLRNTPM